MPYDKYLELQRAAHPDEIVKPAPPAEYALAGGRFTARLDGGESLLVEGHLDVDVLVDHAVSIPLSLGGGVLTKVERRWQTRRGRYAQTNRSGRQVE